MNSQTPTPDDGQPTEPLPAPRQTEPLLPPPPATPQDTAEGAQQGDRPDTPPPAAPGPYAGPYAGPSASQQSGPYPNQYAGAKAPGQPTDFFPWIRSHGIARGRDRWIGGVSSGIAYRMGVDPLIVRGIFIVLTIFAGIGVLLYGLAWAFLPEPDGRIHVQEASAGRWSSGMTGSLIATILGLTGLGGGFWGWNDRGFGPFLWTLFWVGAVGLFIYYLVQRNSATNGTPLSTNLPQPGSAGSTGSSAAGSTGFPHTPYGPSHSLADTTTAGTPPYSPANPAAPHGGTPYGGAPYGAPYGGSAPYGGTPTGGGQPPYGPAREPRDRPAGPGTPAVAISVGAALLVGGGLKALDAGNLINLGDSANAVVWASAAAVLGLGILLSGIRGRTAGILSFFAVVALVTGGIFNIVGDSDRVRFQRVDWAPASIEQATKGLDITAGDGTVDLTTLQLNPPLGSDVVVPLNFTASNVTVVIPDNVPVDIKADMTLGNLNEGNNRRGGATTRESSYNTNRPGSHLVIRINGTVSNVTIQEGN
ncbi:PspC domain-containing protein [Arthrobacter sp. 754]|uniref:PspC domain-containing protein n=1 Tax=Arthrobacter sp. 754 TaxID=3156315 RepID=UPI00339817B4